MFRVLQKDSEEMFKNKILIVEDNESSRNLLEKILTKNGYKVLVADDGRQALDLIDKNKFDAILTDWMMPNLDGLELVQKVRRSEKHQPVVMMITALASRDAKLKALEAGADDYIAKPINRQEVLDRLRNNLLKQDVESSRRVYTDKKGAIQRPPFIGVCISAGTGAPSALVKIAKKLQTNVPAAYFVVFNAPSWMIKSFVDKLQENTSLNVNIAKNGYRIKSGEIYVAPDEYHMVVNPETLTIRLLDSPPENFAKPSADPLLKSAASLFGERCISVILGGMGSDGSIGCGYVNASGGFVIAQEPSTAIAPSMPQTVIDLRIANMIASLEDIPRLITQNIRKLMQEDQQ